MPRRPKWWRMMESARSEAMLAIDLYNQAALERGFEAFIVHMHIAWTYLLHAEFEKEGLDYRYWNAKRTRVIKEGGEPRLWGLADCVAERWPDQHPTRRNIEFMIGLRNQVEHRFTSGVAIAFAGKSQAHVINFETELVTRFGEAHGVAGYLRFPVFVQSLTPTGVGKLIDLQKRLPATTAAYLESFEAGMDEAARADNRYDFRLHLVPQTGPKTDADLAIHFVRLDKLSDASREEFERLGKTGTVIVRDRIRPVVHLDHLRPRQVVDAVAAKVAMRFTMADFIDAWRRLGVRPQGGDNHPEKTDDRYCLWDEAHGDYVYTQAFVNKIARDCGTPEGYQALTGRNATPSNSDQPRW